MKNKFTAGIIVGSLSALLVCSIVFSVLFINYRVSLQDDDSIRTEQSSDTNKQSQAILDDALTKKINFMQSMISKYFLYDVTAENYDDAILKGMMQALEDPYSCYYSVEEYAELNESMNGTYYGIGAYVGQNRETLTMTITKPFPGGPAAIAGILPGDIIYKVDDEDVTGMDINSVVAKMKGEKGTLVKLTILRGDNLEELSFDIIRNEVEVPTVEYKMMDNNIGYIYIAQFDKITVEQFIHAIDDLESQKMEGLIIDIRDNGGGLYTSCTAMLDRLIGKGLLVYTETKNGKREEEYAKTEEEFTKPLVVLVNGNSASASEIFSGAIQDYGVGTIMGTQTFGKGIVQSVIPLYDGSAMKITISNYFTPKGRSIHKVGITPDVEVELDKDLTGLITEEQDNQLQSAIEYLKKEIK